MDTSVIVAILTVIASAISSLSLVNWRISQLEKKVEQHNNLNDTIKDQATDIACMKKDIEYIRKQLENK